MHCIEWLSVIKGSINLCICFLFYATDSTILNVTTREITSKNSTLARNWAGWRQRYRFAEYIRVSVSTPRINWRNDFNIWDVQPYCIPTFFSRDTYFLKLANQHVRVILILFLSIVSLILVFFVANSLYLF